MFATLLAVLFAAILGLAILLFGYRLFLVMLPIWGFFAGFWLGASAISVLIGQGFLATITGWVVGFIVGVILAVLSYLFYMIAVALIAAVIGGALASALMTAIGFDPGFLVSAVAILTGIAVAILALVFNLQKYVIILLSSIGGANLIVLAGLLLFGFVTLVDLQSGANIIRPVLSQSWLALVAWLALAVVGLVVQVRANRTYTFTRERYVEAWG